jgi:hypothetical protein
MFTGLSRSRRSRRPLHTPEARGPRGPEIEGLESRLLYTFNGYISGPGFGALDTSETFVFSTTGQAAKQWVINWGDGTSPETQTAPNQATGWTAPVSFTHTFSSLGPSGPYALTATATSTTNVTAAAVLQENSAWTGAGTNAGNSTGKTVQGLPSTNSVGTNIASVVDDDGTTYVLGTDGKRMAVTRFTTAGAVDTSWTATGSYTLTPFTTATNQDTPRAMAIDKDSNLLYVAGSSGGKWAISRINIDNMGTTPQAWSTSILTGTANALWLDSTDGNTTIGVAGTSSTNLIQMAVLFAIDQGSGQSFHAGGTLETDFGNGTGFATAPNSVYGLPSGWIAFSSASAIIEGDDVGFGGEDEWYVSGTVNYCCTGCNPSSGSDMVIVDFLQDGSTNTAFGNGHGAALYNTCNAYNVTGIANDSSYAMVGSFVDGTGFLTLLGTSSAGGILAERFTSDGHPDQGSFGPILSGTTHRGYKFIGQSGTAFAATLDPTLNKIVGVGTSSTGDFIAFRMNDDGSLDSTFGQSGVIKIDFGSTSANTSDGARAVSMRSLDGGITFDIVVAGYTFDSATGKDKFALVDLLDDHSFHA